MENKNLEYVRLPKFTKNQPKTETFIDLIILVENNTTVVKNENLQNVRLAGLNEEIIKTDEEMIGITNSSRK